MFKVSSHYCLPVTNESFFPIIKLEEVGVYDLEDALSRIDGVFDVEYNGHFGANIFFGIEAEKDILITWAMIAKVFNDFDLVINGDEL